MSADFFGNSSVAEEGKVEGLRYGVKMNHKLTLESN